jgi:hypothetical protein
MEAIDDALRAVTVRNLLVSYGEVFALLGANTKEMEMLKKRVDKGDHNRTAYLRDDTPCGHRPGHSAEAAAVVMSGPSAGC